MRADPKGRKGPVDLFEARTPEAQAEGQADPKGRKGPVDLFEARTPEALAEGQRAERRTANFPRNVVHRAAGAARPGGMRRARAEDGRERPGAGMARR